MPASDAPLPPRRPPLQQNYRGLLWLVFWFLFLGAPATPFINEAMSSTLHIRLFFISEGVTVIASIVGGTLGAGFILARLYSRSTSELIVRGLLFSLGILLFYGTIAFAGCLLILAYSR